DSIHLDIHTSKRYYGLPLAKLYLTGVISKNQLDSLSKLPHNAIHLSKDRKKVIIFDKENIQVIDFKGNSFPKIANMLKQLNFSETNFAGLFIDSEENVWITKLNEGIYHIPFYYKKIKLKTFKNSFAYNSNSLFIYKDDNLFFNFSI